MANNTIGQFIAALRKANGMTQQEVADQLNVSNKAVSRWERDECAPDISLIPSLAEMFGVTCDELLKGQRIMVSDMSLEEKQEKKEPKVQKQIKSLVNRTLSKFKTLNYISVAISVVGLICMFGISYGFYHPTIAFVEMLLLETAAVFLGILALSRARAVKTDNELFEEAAEPLTAKFNRTLGSFSFNAFFAALAVVLLSLPLILSTDESYLTVFFGGIVLILALVFLKGRKPYIERFTGGYKSPAAQKVRLLNIVQLGLLALSAIISVTVSYSAVVFKIDNIWESLIGGIALLACFTAIIVFFVVHLYRNKDYRRDLILTGTRNICLIPAVIIFFDAFNLYRTDYMFSDSVSSSADVWDSAHIEDIDHSMFKWDMLWSPEKLWYAAMLAALVLIIFSVIDFFVKKQKS